MEQKNEGRNLGYEKKDVRYSFKYSNTKYENEGRIRRYRTLSKRAMKEYAMKQANSSGFDWFDEEEEM